MSIARKKLGSQMNFVELMCWRECRRIDYSKWIYRFFAICCAVLVVICTRPYGDGVSAHFSNAFVWLRAGVITAVICSGFVYCQVLWNGLKRLNGHVLKGAMASLVWSGLTIGLAIYAFLPLQDYTHYSSADFAWKFEFISVALLILAVTVCLVDYYLFFNDCNNNKLGIWILDGTIAAAVIFTYVLSRIYMNDFGVSLFGNGIESPEMNHQALAIAKSSASAMAIGFKAGAVAIEIIVANMLFEPTLIKRQFINAQLTSE
jgi:hypothetical protein